MAAPTTTSTTRPAFGLVEGFAIGSVIAGLEMAGQLSALEAEGLDAASLASGDPKSTPAMLLGSLRYLRDRGLAEQHAERFVLTERGREICRDKGYLVWLVGGYGVPLCHVADFVGAGRPYGQDYIRDGKWVANGAAMLGRTDVVPAVMELIQGVGASHVLDLGCGNARFLTRLCERLGCTGLGVDISPAACAEAEKLVAEADLADRVRVVVGDAGDLGAVEGIGTVDLVVTMFLLHEILAEGRDVLGRYLRNMAHQLGAGAHLLIAEVEPPARTGDGHELFTPEFSYVHAMMGQYLIPASEWTTILEANHFAVRKVDRSPMPGCVLVLAQAVPPT
ncbi:SAM-dependent methyltransferase [Pseudonocardia acaciae]|uniref:SAM-dependent methyltransferase n=1 Tax=Pseudonocardia acaciae TaxID=551276 RepID=UPI00048D373B|nr:class I SAM-dependent methyltransferase [Pseudonocardia acaciae]